MTTGPPIDRGWAWACVLGCHVANLFLIGGFKSMGVLIVELNDAFDAHMAATTAMLGLIGGFMSILSAVGTAVGERYTNRAVVIVGGLLVAAGSFFTSFAPSMTAVVITFGALTGLGYGCIFGPANVTIGQYFHKRRSLASGIAVAGGSVGQLLIPLVLRKLIDEYTWRGALLIFSALILHVVAGAMLFRPLSFYKRKPKKHHPGNGVDTGKEPSRVDVDVCKQCSCSDTCKDVKCCHGEGSPMLSSSELTTPAPDNNGLIDHNDTSIKGANDVGKCQHRCNGHLNKVIDRVKAMDEDNYKGNMYSKTKYTSTGSLCIVPFPDIDEVDYLQTQTSDEVGVDTKKRASFLQVLKNSFCCCFAKKQGDSKPESLFDWPLFKNRLFLMYVIGVGLGNTGCVNLFMLIPAQAEDLGFDRQRGALLLSIGGTCDLVSRIGGGWFADLGYLRRITIMAITILLTGIATFILPHIASFWSMVVYVMIVGSMGGAYAALFLVVLIDLIGLERTPKAFGMTITVMGFFNMPIPILLGYLRDATGNCLASFMVCGTFMLICSIILLCEPAIRRMENRRLASAGLPPT